MINVEKEVGPNGEPITSVTMTPVGLGLMSAGLFATAAFATVGLVDLIQLGTKTGRHKRNNDTNNEEEL